MLQPHRHVIILLMLWMLATFFYPQPAQGATERILAYHSDIIVHHNADLTVTERITVRSTGDQIRHGIYRDFPIRYRDARGRTHLVSFRVLTVRRDGHYEPYHLQRWGNGIRVYIGDKNTYIEDGTHDYLLTYASDRQLGFFADHDELYWNVTGNGWVFSIDKATAAVTLPAGIPASALRVEGYTGTRGSKASDMQAWIDNKGVARFATTRPLAAGEGLTIVVSFPKNFVHPPVGNDAIKDWSRAYLPLVLAAISLGVLLGYYAIAWRIVGKDPGKGVIIPRFTPPEGLSPAAMRYIIHMGYDNKAFTAGVLNLAVKGRLTITETPGEYTLLSRQRIYTLSRTEDENDAALPADEIVILKNLFAKHTTVEIKQEQYRILEKATQGVRATLQREMGNGRYFRKNTGYCAGGLVLLLFLAIIVAWAAQSPFTVEPFTLNIQGEGDIFVLAIVGTLFAAVGGVLVFGLGASFWKGVAHRNERSGTDMFSYCCLSLFGLPFLLSGLVALLAYSATYVVYLLSALIIASTFGRLMPAYTLMGRAAMDAIDGFRMYLETAEREEMKLRNPPERTPELFERYLPYALALGVEQEWAQGFAAVLMQAQAGGTVGYHPAWYSGSSWSSVGATGFAASLGGAFSGAIASSSTSPGSSSGSGGGGSSGGGGGGGGGGGW